jgi:hypothetical protein
MLVKCGPVMAVRMGRVEGAVCVCGFLGIWREGDGKGDGPWRNRQCLISPSACWRGGVGLQHVGAVFVVGEAGLFVPVDGEAEHFAGG